MNPRSFVVMSLSETTIAAIATAPGTAALGIIRMSGPQSIYIADRIFPSKQVSGALGTTLHYGKIIKEDGALVDEVLLSVFKAPHSYTGEDLIEISCHGSPYILQQMLNLLLSYGAVLAKPGEFTLRAFLNGKMDLSQAEAVADLIASESDSSHRMAINQLKGGIKKEIENLRSELLEFISLIELELDFAEEDVEFADRSRLKILLDKIHKEIEILKNSFALGNAVKSGIQTVIAGKPNAGKSTLLNALLNEERALVSDIPGTTRDTIEERLTIHGIGFRFIDTAGIRQANDLIESMGVERTFEKIKGSSIVLYVFDASSTTKEELWNELSALKLTDQKFLVIANKMDLNPYKDYTDFINEQIPKEHILPCSAKNKMNIDYLKTRLYELALGDHKLNADDIAINARHFDALHKADINILEAIQGISSNLQTDLLAQQIRLALYHLSEISGEITNDEILGNIFGKFCIGK
jgi:tRNA modification GTPase